MLRLRSLTPVTFLCKLGIRWLVAFLQLELFRVLSFISAAHFTVRSEHLMIKLSEKGLFLASNNEIIAEEHFTGEIKKEEAKKGTIAWSILYSHNMVRKYG
ncbi:hypothetical protein ACLB1R_15080 [Escherichia coli]